LIWANFPEGMTAKNSGTHALVFIHQNLLPEYGWRLEGKADMPHQHIRRGRCSIFVTNIE
jgi:hypothetical protein